MPPGVWTWHLAGPLERRQSRFGARCTASARGWANPPSPARLQVPHTQMMFTAERSRRRQAGGSRGKPKLALAAGAPLIAICRGASSKLGNGSMQRAERAPSPRAQTALRHPSSPELLCLLLGTRDKGGIFMSPDTMTAAPHLLEGVLFCSAHTSRAPVSLGGRRDDSTSLPHDVPLPLPPATQPSAQPLCPWGPTVLPHQPRVAEGLHSGQAGLWCPGAWPSTQGAAGQSPPGKGWGHDPGHSLHPFRQGSSFRSHCICFLMALGSP